jgi:glutamate-1-semialdehyde 2,1-aminomutase
LEQGFLKVAADADVSVQVNRVGSMLTLFFNEHPVTDLQTATASDTDRFARWFHAMLDRGVYLPCSQFEALFVSATHTPELIEQTIAAASEAMLLLSES